MINNLGEELDDAHLAQVAPMGAGGEGNKQNQRNHSGGSWPLGAVSER